MNTFLTVVITLLCVVQVCGMVWAWRFTRGMSKLLRCLFVPVWPLCFIFMFVVVQ